jgi:hypothetical protein
VSELAEDRVSASALRCFVIGPIGNKLAEKGSPGRTTYEEALEVWEEIILSACRSCGLEPVRADGLARAGEITEQIFRRLRDDDVVIADLTGANANVMYELGLRHTRDLLTVQVGEYGRLPFDVQTIRTVMFSRSPLGLINARNELIEMLQQGLAGQYDPVSATRVWTEVGEAENSAAIDSVPGKIVRTGGNDDDGPGFLDLVAEGEDKQLALNEAAVSISKLIEQLGELAEKSAGEMQTSDARGAGMKGRLAVVARFASGLDSIAQRLEEYVDQYVEAMEVVSSANLAIAERLEADPSQVGKGMDWGMGVRRLAKVSRESMANLNEMSSSMVENAKLSRVMRPATRRVTEAFQRFEEATSALDELDRRLQVLGVPVPPDDWEPSEPASSEE